MNWDKLNKLRLKFLDYVEDNECEVATIGIIQDNFSLHCHENTACHAGMSNPLDDEDYDEDYEEEEEEEE